MATATSVKADAPGTLKTGREVNLVLKRFVDPNYDFDEEGDNKADTTIKEIEFLSSLATVPTSFTNSASIGDDVIAYYNSSTKKISIYTEADKFIFNPTCFYMFADLKALTTLNFGNKIDTSQVTEMDFMFSGCESLTSLDVTKFNTSNVIDMDCMFQSCRALTTVNITGFDASSVSDLSYMFYWCTSLTSLDFSNFDTTNVTDMSGMFEYCWALTTLDLSHFDTTKVKKMEEMFNECSELSTLDISNFNMNNVSTAGYMFSIKEGGNIYLPASFHKFDTYWETNPDAFSELDTSVTVHYPGTIAQWEAFGYTFPNVVCSDGTPVILSDNMISLTATEYSFTGSPITPSVKVTYNGTVLTNGTHYTLECTNNINVGTATVTVKGKSPYAGTISRTFTIKQKAINNATLTLSESTFTYDGTAKEPSVTVVLDGKTLASGTDYSVSYTNNTNAGTATVTVTGTGNYTGTATTNFTINESVKEDDSKSPDNQSKQEEKVDKKQKTTSVSKVKPGKKSATVSWKKQTSKGIKGYEIQYSTDKKFKKNVKTITINKTKTTSKKIKKLKSKKTYYIRIRTYKQSKSVKTYSKWSKAKSVTVK
ncbi:MAG: BspA family leucine-rich repeat surface protein [Lachnospiraceae bacterium]|nr:BspA family leucine-rich repeat surface protein [Lachnospiraceae bacterium]